MQPLIPTISEICTNGPFKISVSASFRALDSNRVDWEEMISFM